MVRTSSGVTARLLPHLAREPRQQKQSDGLSSVYFLDLAGHIHTIVSHRCDDGRPLFNDHHHL